MRDVIIPNIQQHPLLIISSTVPARYENTEDPPKGKKILRLNTNGLNRHDLPGISNTMARLSRRQRAAQQGRSETPPIAPPDTGIRTSPLAHVEDDVLAADFSLADFSDTNNMHDMSNMSEMPAVSESTVSYVVVPPYSPPMNATSNTNEKSVSIAKREDARYAYYINGK